MPKQVDHVERRQALAQAVYAVIGEQGIEAVSLRDVARQAGVSMGAVQHYFDTKAEMLLFALSHMRERVGRRLAAEMALLPQPATRRDTVRHALRAMMPVDGPSREEATVNVAFFTYATVDPAYADQLRDGYAHVLDLMRSWLRAAADAGELRRGVDPAAAATTLYVLTQGFVGPLLIGVFDGDEAMALIDRSLDQIFRPGPG
ncbi:TetR/AcrR family transcriptional regulator [Hamadaea tsunoensis]|uniref:TetR/AcrR family transcriptional regulator n=1 Tax=Hamadaea tsunoensis TaxID=53368 RepID=UPI0004062886|nr:TetR/AcrR family transcriptional regulator [Hamadaea tsunoensis]